MNLNLSGKIAFVSGSTKGIGLAILRRLHEEGCTVICNSRHQQDIDLIRNELRERVDGFVADLSLESECQKLQRYIEEKHGRLDILVLNAGSGKGKKSGEETFADWKFSIDANLHTVTHPLICLKAMILHSKSAVTVISSIAALEFLGAPLTYSSVKAALHPMIKSLSFSFGDNGARINIVAPGNILFSGSTWENKMNEKKDETLAYISKEVPMKRFGKPEEVADLVAFLSSDRAAFITGSTMVIDGGQTKTYF